jgi:hypothetical protein
MSPYITTRTELAPAAGGVLKFVLLLHPTAALHFHNDLKDFKSDSTFLNTILTESQRFSECGLLEP